MLIMLAVSRLVVARSVWMNDRATGLKHLSRGRILSRRRRKSIVVFWLLTRSATVARALPLEVSVVCPSVPPVVPSVVCPRVPPVVPSDPPEAISLLSEVYASGFMILASGTVRPCRHPPMVPRAVGLKHFECGAIPSIPRMCPMVERRTFEARTGRALVRVGVAGVSRV